MSIAVITGSAGLIGSEAASFFSKLGLEVVGIDNDMRSHFFGAEASNVHNQQRLKSELGSTYQHSNFDIRDTDRINQLFSQLGKNISLVIHTAAQPSHDWAARDPHVDFSVNALGTLNLLEATRQFCPDAPFILHRLTRFTATRPTGFP
jgi:CDP-paratose 2-epimerase